MCRDCTDLTMVCWAEFERQHDAERRMEALRATVATVPADPACAICGQLHGLTMSDLVEQDRDLPVYCLACEARLCDDHQRLDCARCSHAPQGEAMRLFAPAPNQLNGQLGF